MIKLSKNKIPFIITSAALLSAVISCMYARRENAKADDEALNALLKFRRVREQNVFPHPVQKDLERLTGNGCEGIANQLEINSYSDDDFGNFSRECAVFILRNIAENMREGETLAEYFARKNEADTLLEYYTENGEYLE